PRALPSSPTRRSSDLAVTVGFGASRRVRDSAPAAMLLAVAGMGASAFVGTLAGRAGEALVAVALLWGFGTGLLAVLKSDAGWARSEEHTPELQSRLEP